MPRYVAPSGGSSGGTAAIVDNSGTPALASGITEGEVKTLLNLENADIVAAVEGETGSVDFTGDITIAAGKKLTARRLNTISVDGDTTLSESSHAGRYIFVTDSNDGAKPVITLPENAGSGVRFLLIGTHEFEIARSGSDTLNGGTANIDVPINEFVTCVSDGSNYFVSKIQQEVFIVSLSDETSDLTAGTGKASFHMPFAMTLTSVKATVNTAPTGRTIEVDINEGGSTILSTEISIDVNEKTSTTAATPAVINDADLADDALLTFDIDNVGSTVAGKGLKVTLVGIRT